MKKILIAAALSGLGATSALAADMAVKAPVYTKAPIVAPYSWTGFYLGANVGGSVGRSRTNESDPGGINSNQFTYLSAAGAIGGGQIGYNWQTNMGFPGPVVFGLEADIQGSGQKTTDCIALCRVDGTIAVNLQQKIDWFGTVRGRIGLANGPVLSYVTGGYAYGNVSTSGSVTGGALPGVPFSLSQTRGGYTLGSGVEASLGGNWTGKIEYLYVDLGTQSQLVSGTAAIFGNPLTMTSRVRDNIFRGGINYAFNGNSNYKAPVANWSGLYIGGNVGSLTARDQSTFAIPGLANQQLFHLVPDGYAGGAQIGYNWQASAWVFGLEADFQGASSKDNKNCIVLCDFGGSGVVYDQKTPYFGTVRGRIGYSVGSTLFYGTAGFAYGQTKTTVTSGVIGFATQTVVLKHNKGGYAVGGGIESPLSLFGPAWTVKAEYLFVDLGKTTDSFADVVFGGIDTFTTRTQEHIFRGGINYHFNAPVVAKY